MGLFDKLRGEFIDIIEWTDDSRDTLVYRFDRRDNEIKMGAKLVVRESQVAVFINQGQLADVFKPGMHTLETSNLPILSTLQGWKYGFHSPFKAEVYFVNTRQFTEQKWGTKGAVNVLDPSFNKPIPIRAFGTFIVRVADPAVLLREVAATDSRLTTDEILGQVRDTIVSRFANALAKANTPFALMSTKYDELGVFVAERIKDDVAALGFQITKLLIENISTSDDIQKTIDRSASVSFAGDLNQYTQMQAADAIGTAAANPGIGGAGAGMGAGFAIGNQMTQAFAGMGQSPGPQRPNGPPPLPGEVSYHAAIGGKAQGPFLMNALQQSASSGALTRDTLVWKEGMAQWTKAGEVAELSALFKAVPPPLPQ